MLYNEIYQVTIYKGDKLKKMKQQKSHARIHKVILQLREKSRQELNDIVQQKYQQNDKPSLSPSLTMENSDVLSLNQTQSIILPEDYSYHPNSQNLNLTYNTVSSQSLSPQKSQHSNNRREIKTARPVSRRKFTSKQKTPNTKNPKLQEVDRDPKKSTTFQLLQILDPSYFIIDKNQNHNDDPQNKQVKSLKAFWSLQHSFVSLFPIEYTQCIIYDHSNIIPIYGEVNLHNCRFVVSNEYKNSSLRDLISEFGAFSQNLCKKYLYQIICGVQQIHNRKTTHNRLSSNNILYNKKGQVFINVVKSTSRPLTQKQKHQKLFYYSPQLLLTKSKSNSLKNDIWSIGIILLDMLFDFTTANLKNIPFHPYNQTQNLSSNDLIIIDNLKQLYPKSFQPSKQVQISEKIQQKYQKISCECKDVIKKCLLVNKDERIDIKTLKTHKFFG